MSECVTGSVSVTEVLSLTLYLKSNDHTNCRKTQVSADVFRFTASFLVLLKKVVDTTSEISCVKIFELQLTKVFTSRFTLLKRGTTISSTKEGSVKKKVGHHRFTIYRKVIGVHHQQTRFLKRHS